MKKLLLTVVLILLVCCQVAGARTVTVVTGQGVAAAGGTENIGNTSQAGTRATFADDYMYCTRLTSTPAHDGSVDSITFTGEMLADASGSIYFSIYTNGTAKPGSLVANSNVGPVSVTYSGGAAHDVTYTYSGTKPSVTTGTTYWICVNNDGTSINTSTYCTDGTGTCSGTGNCSVAEANAHDNFPSDWSAITPDFSDDGRWRGKLYFTYSY